MSANGRLALPAESIQQRQAREMAEQQAQLQAEMFGDARQRLVASQTMIDAPVPASLQQQQQQQQQYAMPPAQAQPQHAVQTSSLQAQTVLTAATPGPAVQRRQQAQRNANSGAVPKKATTYRRAYKNEHQGTWRKIAYTLRHLFAVNGSYSVTFDGPKGSIHAGRKFDLKDLQKKGTESWAKGHNCKCDFERGTVTDASGAQWTVDADRKLVQLSQPQAQQPQQPQQQAQQQPSAPMATMAAPAPAPQPPRQLPYNVEKAYKDAGQPWIEPFWPSNGPNAAYCDQRALSRQDAVWFRGCHEVLGIPMPEDETMVVLGNWKFPMSTARELMAEEDFLFPAPDASLQASGDAPQDLQQPVPGSFDTGYAEEILDAAVNGIPAFALPPQPENQDLAHSTADLSALLAPVAAYLASSDPMPTASSALGFDTAAQAPAAPELPPWDELVRDWDQQPYAPVDEYGLLDLASERSPDFASQS